MERRPESRPQVDRLSAVVLELCDAATVQGDPILDGHVSQIRAALQQPLRVAVVGRVNAGKSTLVNALIKRRVAPTLATECTQLVTWYRYGVQERVEVHLLSGEVNDVQLEPTGQLPSNWSAPLDEIGHLEVYLSQSLLKSVTIIDTPGLNAISGHNSGRTTTALGIQTASELATGHAEAVLFVFSSAMHAGEVDVLHAFQEVSLGAGHPPVNVLGVLAKADLLSDPATDPWIMADELARRYSVALAGHVSEVEPVAGLIAETIGAGKFTESDAAALSLLAAMPPPELAAMFLSADRFVSRSCPVSTAHRRSLLTALGRYGVQVAVAAIQGGARGAVALQQLLGDRSRIDTIEDRVHRRFARRADSIKAEWALNRLSALAYERSIARPQRLWLADSVEMTRLKPVMQDLLELAALNDLLTGSARLPDELGASLRCLLEHDEPVERLAAAPTATAPELIGAARALSDALVSFAFSAAPQDEHVARIGSRACQRLIQQLSETRVSDEEGSLS